MSDSSNHTTLPNEPILQVVPAVARSIGTETVLRLLPTVKQRTVGPFVFLDHMGPQSIGQGARPVLVDVPPHPHTGLATVTFLFEGAVMHRDSIGSEQLIEPGAVNWMTAGRGIVHSERTPKQLRRSPPNLFGLQCWVALPADQEDAQADFQHVAAEQLPLFERDGVMVRVIAGSAFGFESPVRVASPLLCVSIEAKRSGRLTLDPEHEERAVILLEGEAQVDETVLQIQALTVLRPGVEAQLSCSAGSRLFLLGGPPLPERRYLDWNFCATSRERLEQAKDLYGRGELGTIAGEGPNLPLPEDLR